MFKELKVLKLVLFVVILLLIIFNINFNKYSGVVFYPSKHSYQLGEKIEINIGNLIDNSINSNFIVTDWNGRILGNETIQTTLQISDPSLVYSDGFQHIITKEITSLIKQKGVYFINDSIPFFVSSQSAKDILVIYPSLGNLLTHKMEPNNQNAFDDVHKSLWKNRPVGMDEKSKNLMNFLISEYSHLSIEFVSDLDPNIRDLIQNSKMLIVYGYSRYATKEYWTALNDFCLKNGKVIFFSSYLPEYAMHPLNSTQLGFGLDSNENFENLSDSLLPFHFKFGGYPESLYYAINKQFNLSNHSDIKINGLGNIFVGSKSGDYWFSMPTLFKENKGKSGIIVFEERLVSFGTEEWLASENFSRKELKKLTKEIIDYLLNKKD